MNDRAEECDPPLLAATSAQARPRLQVAEILGPIAGTMIASAAAELGLTVSCQPGLGSDEIITVLSNRSLTLPTPLVCGHCVVCMMTRCPGGQVARCSSLLVRCCQETAGCLLSPSSGSTLSWSPVSTGPGPHPAYGRGTLLATTGRSPVLHCTALYCTVLHCTVISSHTGQRTAHVPTTHYTQLGLVPAPAPTLHTHNSNVNVSINH